MAGNKREKGDGKGRQGGRKPGTPNKVTGETRELLKKFVSENWEGFIEDYKSIPNKKDKCMIMVGLLQFVSPKLANVEYKDKDKPQTLQDELDADSGLKSRK